MMAESAASRLFAIPELLEQILLHFCMKELFQLQRVSKACVDTIQGSKKLRQVMLLEHSSGDVELTHSINPLLEHEIPFLRDVAFQYRPYGTFYGVQFADNSVTLRIGSHDRKATRYGSPAVDLDSRQQWLRQEVSCSLSCSWRQTKLTSIAIPVYVQLVDPGFNVAYVTLPMDHPRMETPRYQLWRWLRPDTSMSTTFKPLACHRMNAASGDLDWTDCTLGTLADHVVDELDRISELEHQWTREEQERRQREDRVREAKVRWCGQVPRIEEVHSVEEVPRLVEVQKKRRRRRSMLRTFFCT